MSEGLEGMALFSGTIHAFVKGLGENVAIRQFKALECHRVFVELWI